MKVCLVVLGLVALSAAAPQNWPYRDSLMPYRYGYPTQTQYKYLPQIEDDEDVGPYLGVGRQDVVVGSDGDRVRPTPESVAPGVIETGSVAPVVEATKAPAVVQPARVSPPPPKPVGPGLAQPPVFPPARPPPTPPPRKVKDEDEDEDEDDDTEEDADDETGPEEGDDDGAGPDEDNDDEEEEEERRRQEPLNSDETVEVPSAVVVDKVKPVPVPAAQPVVPPTPPKQPVVVTESSVEDVNATQVVESNEVGQSQGSEDESSEEQGLGGGVEALVPGYVTDQGEVLVPVDTVTGDQPISIVPDPYSPPARGVQLRGSHTYRSPYEDVGYSNPYYYPEDIYENLGRQEDSEEDTVSGPNPDDEDGQNEEEESSGNAEGRNEYLTAFPPSRTPELFALINSRFAEQQQFAPQQYQGPYAPLRHQAQPVLYRVRQQENNPSVSLAVRVTGGGSGGYTTNNVNPYVNRFASNQFGYQESGEDQFSGYVPPYTQGLRGPYSPSPYRPRPQYNPYGGYGYPTASYGARPRPQYRPRPVYAGGAYGRPYGPRPVYAGQRPRPVFRPSYGPYRGPQNVVIRRRPIAASIQPIAIGYKSKKPVHPLSTKFVNKRPTPIEYQDEEPYPFETPFAPYGREPVDPSYVPYHHRQQVAPPSESTQESTEQGPRENKKVVTAVAPKSRRAAKMTKKMNKKTMEKKKKMTDPDPLNILKKINLKRS